MGRTGKRVVQVDPTSGDFFDIGLQPSLVQLVSDCREGEGLARAGHDDICAIGPVEVVLPAVQKFQREVWDRCHLRLQWTKTQLFSWNADLPADVPVGMFLAGEMVDGLFERGFKIYGIPIGTDKCITCKLMQRAEQILKDAKQTVTVLNTDRKALWSALHLSISHRFD